MKIILILENEIKYYYPDYIDLNTNIIYEIKPISMLNVGNNPEKFKAAKLKFGNNFKIVTEKDLFYDII